MNYIPYDSRYADMQYRRCGKSGIDLPVISLGLWHNFGHTDDFENCRRILRYAFDQGITHFDLANNYGHPAGSAEENFGKILQKDFRGYRDEMIISTKAGYYMWPGPYGDHGSKKYLVSSLDQSLQRMGLSYVDIFYHHRPDPATPLEETMAALDLIVRQGKALYVGISNYPPELTLQASKLLRQMGTPCLIHQPKYSMFERWVEDGLLEVLETEGIGCIAFSPLAQGMLTSRYLDGSIPPGSRASKPEGFLKPSQITPDKIEKFRRLNDLAKERGQTLAQLALTWILKDPRVTSVLTGASSVNQLAENMGILSGAALTDTELSTINTILS